jgi:hypothetical protein
MTGHFGNSNNTRTAGGRQDKRREETAGDAGEQQTGEEKREGRRENKTAE